MSVELKPWWQEGIRFECQGSGKCCTSHGEFGYVFLTLEDRQRIAKHLKISTRKFTMSHCEKLSGVWHLIENPNEPNCRFLDGKACGIYEARPTQCRTWPFWPEVMDAKSWKKDVKQFCPGVGKGKLWSKDEIDHQLTEQKKSEKRYRG